MVADSDALRSRRRRRHVAGDHTLCRPNCMQRGTRTLREVLALPPDADVNARAEMNALALRLRAAHEADPSNAIVARELRLTLEALDRLAPASSDPLDDLRAFSAGLS